MEPLLSSLCTICHIDPPKYTCPRCSAQTCSLACSKRHKLWSTCNGVRDPTVFKPMSQLATPSGIDHDYNFLHSIEIGISRSEKVLIEDVGAVTKEELEMARTGETEAEWRRRTRKHVNEPPGEVCMWRALQENNIKVHKAPKGMRRNQENTTCWNKRHKVIHWQLEWLMEDGSRSLCKAFGSETISTRFDALCEEERKLGLSEKERALEKKRKATEFKERRAKRARIEQEDSPTAPMVLQNPSTGAWNVSLKASASPVPTEDLPPAKHRQYHFYLHRPLTPASLPRVLVPIDTASTFTDILKGRDFLEFPSIHVLKSEPSQLPQNFMLERKYIAASQHLASPDLDTELNDRRKGDGGDDDDSSSSDTADSSASSESSSEESSDAKLEEGQVA